MSYSDHAPVEKALRRLEAGKAREAFVALKSLAEAGNTEAYPMLGYLYDIGEGTWKDAKQARHWYELGYKSGSAICASNLATVCRDAGDSRNEYKWYRRAADLGDGDALVEVAIRLLSGKGVRRNLTGAIRLLKQVEGMADTSEAGRNSARQLLRGCEEKTARPAVDRVQPGKSG
jgi:TPR repeat protein